MSLPTEFLGGLRPTGPARFDGPVFEGSSNGVAVATLGAGVTRTLTITSAKFQKLTPDAAHNNVVLPAVGLSKGLSFWIASVSTGNAVVKDAAGTTIGTCVPLRLGCFACDGTSWVCMGISTVAFS